MQEVRTVLQDVPSAESVGIVVCNLLMGKAIVFGCSS